MTAAANIQRRVAAYYEDLLRKHGAVAQGVDWNSAGSQSRRFDELLRIHRDEGEFSINDYGCGYGALVDHLQRRGAQFRYAGYDVAGLMLAEARARHRDKANVRFVGDAHELKAADYTVASGIFNVKLDILDEAWSEYVFESIEQLAVRSKRGFAFNMLTKYSDRERKRADLHYADPALIFDRCQRRYSRWVAVLQDYGLYEFTVLVRLEGGTPWRG